MKKIKLWKNKNELSDKVALIDDEDYEKVIEAIRHKNGKPGKWYAQCVQSTKVEDYIYAVSGSRDKAIHRVVTAAPLGMDVDHANGNRLDNRKENLRVCSRAQNSQNKKLRCDSKSGYKGVYEVRAQRSKYTSKKSGEAKFYESELKRLKRPWRAYIGDPETSFPNKRHIRLGYFATPEEAARAYDEKAKELYGEFAYLNFPD